MGAVQLAQCALVVFLITRFISERRSVVLKDRKATEEWGKEVAYQLSVIPN